MIRRWLEPVLNAQAAWADPLGGFMQRIFRAIYGPFPALRDFLHGTWLGHPVHPMITDVPIGALIIGTVLDVVGQPTGATWAIGIGFVGLLASALAGYADYLDLEGAGKRIGSLHSTSMLIAALLYFARCQTLAGQGRGRERGKAQFFMSWRILRDHLEGRNRISAILLMRARSAGCSTGWS